MSTDCFILLSLRRGPHARYYHTNAGLVRGWSLGAFDLHVLLGTRLQAAARHEFTGFEERSLQGDVEA